MGFELLEMNDDLYSLLNEVIRERDELIDRLESCRMALDDMRAHCEEFKAEARRLKEELGNANEYGDCEHNYADCLKLEIKQARQKRDEAREVARFFRDVYVSQVGRTYPEEYRLPWEAEE